MSKLTDDDKAFCAAHGLTYFPPEYVSLEEFEEQGQYFQNQGPAQGDPQMWTLGANRYLAGNDCIQESDTSTSRSEYIGIALVALAIVVIAVLLNA